jgi:hypothetical protein
MKIQISEATPLQINWAVAKCEGVLVRWSAPHAQLLIEGYPYLVWQAHKDWAQGGPIIEREQLFVCPYDPSGMGWRCTTKTADYALPSERQYRAQFGQTPLIAAMRCYVASRLGDEIDIPEELT